MARRTWIRIDGKLYCYRSWCGGCSDAHFLTSDQQSEDLQDATDEINRILDGLKERHPGLAILSVGEFLVLMDVEHDDEEASRQFQVGGPSEEEAIRDALSIRQQPQG